VNLRRGVTKGAVVFCLGCLTGCRTVGDDVTNGALDAFRTNGPSTIRAATKAAGDGLRDDILGPQTTAQAQEMVTQVGGSVDAQVLRMRDDALGAETRAELEKLVNQLLARLDAQTRATSHALVVQLGKDLREQVLNDDFRSQILLTVKTTGDAAIVQAGSLRDELLGQHTADQIRIIAKTAADAMLAPTHVELSWIERNATVALVGVAVLAFGLIAFSWWEKLRYQKTLELLTVQIDRIPNRANYDELVHRIQSSAQDRGVEPILRQVLARNGLLAQPSAGASQ